MKTIHTLLSALLLCAATTSQAQHQGHGAPAKAATAATAVAPSTAEFEAGATRMHSGMAITYTGNTDIDFARGMIPHHQGAIDMAKVVLTHGKDPEIRKLAEGVIREQEKEIAMMRDWLKKSGR